MNISKCGDYLFVVGLWKVIGDVVKLVCIQIGEISEGCVLVDVLFVLQCELGGSEFDVMINQGWFVVGFDLYLVIFGRVVECFK